MYRSRVNYQQGTKQRQSNIRIKHTCCRDFSHRDFHHYTQKIHKNICTIISAPACEALPASDLNKAEERHHRSKPKNHGARAPYHHRQHTEQQPQHLEACLVCAAAGNETNNNFAQGQNHFNRHSLGFLIVDQKGTGADQKAAHEHDKKHGLHEVHFEHLLQRPFPAQLTEFSPHSLCPLH